MPSRTAYIFLLSGKGGRQLRASSRALSRGSTRWSSFGHRERVIETGDGTAQALGRSRVVKGGSYLRLVLSYHRSPDPATARATLPLYMPRIGPSPIYPILSERPAPLSKASGHRYLGRRQPLSPLHRGVARPGVLAPPCAGSAVINRTESEPSFEICLTLPTGTYRWWWCRSPGMWRLRQRYLP